MRRFVSVLHAHPSCHANYGAAAAERPPSFRCDGLDRCRRREARTLCALCLRERKKVPILPRRPSFAITLQQAKRRDACAAERALTTPIARVIGGRAWRNFVINGESLASDSFFSGLCRATVHKIQLKGRNKSWIQSNRIF